MGSVAEKQVGRMKAEGGSKREGRRVKAVGYKEQLLFLLPFAYCLLLSVLLHPSSFRLHPCFSSFSRLVYTSFALKNVNTLLDNQR